MAAERPLVLDPATGRVEPAPTGSVLVDSAGAPLPGAATPGVNRILLGKNVATPLPDGAAVVLPWEVVVEEEPAAAWFSGGAPTDVVIPQDGIYGAFFGFRAEGVDGTSMRYMQPAILVDGAVAALETIGPRDDGVAVALTPIAVAHMPPRALVAGQVLTFRATQDNNGSVNGTTGGLASGETFASVFRIG